MAPWVALSLSECHSLPSPPSPLRCVGHLGEEGPSSNERASAGPGLMAAHGLSSSPLCHFFISRGASLAGPSHLHAPHSSQGVNTCKMLLNHGCPRSAGNSLTSRPLSQLPRLSPGRGRQVQTSFCFLDRQTDRQTGEHTPPEARGPSRPPCSLLSALLEARPWLLRKAAGRLASARIEGRPLGSSASRGGDGLPSLPSLPGRAGETQEAATPLNLLTGDREAW